MAIPKSSHTFSFSFHDELWVYAADLRQFAYCPRIVFYSRNLNLKPPSTALMAQGKKEQANFDLRQKRHRLARLGFVEPIRHPDLLLSSERVGLVGRVDLVLEASDKIAIVEVKYSQNEPSAGYILQLVAYAFLAEEYFGKPCPVSFFYYLPARRWVPVSISPERREQCLQVIMQVREILKSGDLPLPTPLHSRCVRCEFLRFCGDRW